MIKNTPFRTHFPKRTMGNKNKLDTFTRTNRDNGLPLKTFETLKPV